MHGRLPLLYHPLLCPPLFPTLYNHYFQPNAVHYAHDLRRGRRVCCHTHHITSGDTHRATIPLKAEEAFRKADEDRVKAADAARQSTQEGLRGDEVRREAATPVHMHVHARACTCTCTYTCDAHA